MDVLPDVVRVVLVLCPFEEKEESAKVALSLEGIFSALEAAVNPSLNPAKIACSRGERSCIEVDGPVNEIVCVESFFLGVVFCGELMV